MEEIWGSQVKQCLKLLIKGSEVAQQVLAAKSDNFEFCPWNLHRRNREPTPTNRPLTSTRMLWHCAPTHMQLVKVTESVCKQELNHQNPDKNGRAWEGTLVSQHRGGGHKHITGLLASKQGLLVNSKPLRDPAPKQGKRPETGHLRLPPSLQVFKYKHFRMTGVNPHTQSR